MNGTEAWNTIRCIRAARGTKEKMRVLSLWPDFQLYLAYAYDPYIQYYITLPSTSVGLGDDELDSKTFNLLLYLHDKKYVGTVAKTALKAEMSRLNYASGEVLKGILNRTFDFGLGVTSISKVFPNCIQKFSLQLAKPVDWNRVVFPCFVSPKLDGLRCIWRNGVFYSRRGHVLQGLNFLNLHIEELFMDEEPQALDGELIIPGKHFDEISGSIRSFKESNEVVYHVFDLPDYSTLGGFVDRYNKLCKLFARSINGSNLKLVRHTKVNSIDDVSSYYSQYRSEGYEGLMIKYYYGQYNNSRTWDWMKMKNKDTEDLKVVGIFEGEGKYEGLVGGIIVERSGVRISVGSGLSDIQRLRWAEEPELIVGKTVEIAYQEVTPQGSLRHPRLVQVRGDL